MADCSGFIQPLDFECILLNTFAGSVPIFIAIGMLFFSGLAAYFKMSGKVFFAMMGIFLVMMAGFADVSAFLFLFLAIGSILLFWRLSKLFSR